MKALKINTLAKAKIFSIVFIFAVSIGLQTASAQMFYSNFEGSQVKISGTRNNAQFAPITNYFSCEGKFTMINGELDCLNSLSFNLPLNIKKDQVLINKTELATNKSQNDINFELTHSMVLPQLHIIHAIGYLNVQGVRTRINFNLDYIENTTETLTVMGRKTIKLSDYKRNAISIFADTKAQDIIQLDLKLVVKNPVKIEYIAAVAK